MAEPKPLDIETLREWLRYDADTGKLYWKKYKGGNARAGDEAATTTVDGYRRVAFERRSLKAHRIAWALYYNEQPPMHLDHINGDPVDNRIANLRPCVPRQNSRNAGVSKNSTSGYKGVARSAAAGRWRAYINVNRKQISLGSYSSPEEAALAYNDAALKLHGEFARLNDVPAEAKAA